MSTPPKNILIIGGGAAGFFGAIHAARNHPQAQVTIVEKSPSLLTKVKISGGGRCNVTHNCFDPKKLVDNYPRGHRELLGPFHTFQPTHTLEFFKKHGISIKAEADGRMFPTTDDSQTIINCFLNEAEKLNIDIQTRTGVEQIENIGPYQFKAHFNCKDPEVFDRVLIATGGGPANKGFPLAQSLGHTIVDPVPSLFTFNIKDLRIDDLQGISFPDSHVSVTGTKLKSTGPLLITHWGLSGPGILRISAWGARILHEKDYKFDLLVNFLPHETEESLTQQLVDYKKTLGKKQVIKNTCFDLPKRFWEKIVDAAGISESQTFAKLPENLIKSLVNILQASTFHVDGKSTYKDEFVTAGGVNLKEINFKTMESKLCPGIYFAGEVLDIDGVTGGFNFQAAWTTSFIAANAM